MQVHPPVKGVVIMCVSGSICQRFFGTPRSDLDVMDMSKASRGRGPKSLPLSKPRTLGQANRNLYQLFVAQHGPTLSRAASSRLASTLPSDISELDPPVRVPIVEDVRAVLRDPDVSPLPVSLDRSATAARSDPDDLDLDSCETDNRREAKRWCFTLNNPTHDDFPPDYETTQEVVPSVYFDYLLVGNETSSTGTPHLQGFICFKEKHRLSWIIKNLFVSRTTGKGRASWRVCKGTVQENIDYCKKGDQTKEEWLKFKTKGPHYGLNAQIAEYGEAPKEGRGQGKVSRDAVFGAALATGNVDSAMLYLAENAARDYCLQRQNLQRNFAVHFTPKLEYKPLYPLESFNHIPLQFSNQHATLVWGETNCGKTAFVKAHFKNPLFCTHVDDLKEFKNSEHDAIIFDDMSFRHMPAETVIHLLETDNPASIHVRYGVVKIPPRVVKVFTHNTPNPFYAETVLEQHQKAIDRRFKRFHVMNKLF